MIEEKLFKCLKNHKNFNDFYCLYLKNNPVHYFSYDILFRDWAENNYDEKEYKNWHKYLLNIIGEDGYDTLLRLFNV